MWGQWPGGVCLELLGVCSVLPPFCVEDHVWLPRLLSVCHSGKTVFLHFGKWILSKPLTLKPFLWKSSSTAMLNKWFVVHAIICVYYNFQKKKKKTKRNRLYNELFCWKRRQQLGALNCHHYHTTINWTIYGWGVTKTGEILQLYVLWA